MTLRNRHASWMHLGNGAAGADERDAEALFKRVSGFMAENLQINTVVHVTGERKQNYIKIRTHEALEDRRLRLLEREFPGLTYKVDRGYIDIDVPLDHRRAGRVLDTLAAVVSGAPMSRRDLVETALVLVGIVLLGGFLLKFLLKDIV
jgi:hypothetical protein